MRRLRSILIGGFAFVAGCPAGSDDSAGTDVPAESADEDGGACEALRCHADCISHGYAGGSCAGAMCNCHGDPGDGGADADGDAETAMEAEAEADAVVDAGECSGRGTMRTWGSVRVCACDPGFTPSTSAGLDCVPTSTVCTGGAIAYDVDGDGVNETRFDPSAQECRMYELVNLTRATHDDEGTPECHTPLSYSVEWSAHGRNHSRQMYERGGLYHEDYPWGQNCAYGCDPACEIDMYMTGPSEPHCEAISHHCNIMRCGFSAVGIGYWPPEDGTYNTQNFL
ncbi:MAG: CAP domain-containing protein [Deltaproteobacteria bacterium]|nr:CAP domain-containing protein [Deltaproteobacteria bacterium]